MRTLPCNRLLQYAINMNFGEMESKHLSLTWKLLGLHPSTLVRVSNISLVVYQNRYPWDQWMATRTLPCNRLLQYAIYEFWREGKLGA
jgi:hypothetical protein